MSRGLRDGGCWTRHVPRDSLTSLKRQAGHAGQPANPLNRKNKRLPVNEMKHALFAQACNNRITVHVTLGKIIVVVGAHPHNVETSLERLA
jgi:hypothetical protein